MEGTAIVLGIFFFFGLAHYLVYSWVFKSFNISLSPKTILLGILLEGVCLIVLIILLLIWHWRKQDKKRAAQYKKGSFF